MALDARPPTAYLPSFTVGDWLVEPRTCRLRRLERVRRLRPQLVDVLVCLAKRPGDVVLRDEILAEVWPGQYIAACGLTRCVAELRQALDDDARQPRYIEATRKRGYRLIAPVVWLEPASAAAGSGDDPGAAHSRPTDARGLRGRWWVGRHWQRLGRWVGLWPLAFVVAGAIVPAVEGHSALVARSLRCQDFSFPLLVACPLAAHPVAAAEIHDAVRSGDVAVVKALLDRTPALVNLKDESGQTPLHVAAQGRNPALVPLLVERGADVKATDNQGVSPLHLLAHGGDLAGITLLADKGADVNLKAADGATPLHGAALGRKPEAIRLLASRKADLEIANSYGRTPLVIAAREMCGAPVIAALLDVGARIDATDKYGETALSLAAWRGSADVVSLLVSRGATVPVNSAQGREVLARAVSTGMADLFQKMLDKGAELTVAPAPSRTLLHDAAEGGAVPIIAALLERRFEINRADANGWTPLHFAADMGRGEAVTFLLGSGAELNARTLMGQSAFNLAQDSGDKPMMDLLAGKGADRSPARFPNLRGPYMGQKPPGRTPEVFAPGIVSARYGLHSNVVFSPDGTEAFWSVQIPARTVGYGRDRTMVSRLVNGRWTYPQAAVFDGVALADVPFFHPDGQRLYDMSARPMPGAPEASGEHIWVWQKVGASWTKPRPLDATVNRLPHHWQFSVDRAGTLYFSSRWAGARGIFASRLVNGAYTDPVSLEWVLGPDARFPFVAPDGSYLLCVRGMQDVHVSFRNASGQWGPPVALGADYNGMLPMVSPDGKYLFVGRGSQTYWADTSVIEEKRPK